ncbi:MAG: hypothetical protein ACFE0J_20385 [Elainellaceae cyanobacterium]
MTQTVPTQPPTERTKPAKPGEIFANILGTFALVILANFLADGFLNYLTSNRGYFLVSRKWQILSELKQPVDWLILGDSSCNQGVIPERFSETLGGTAVNLCTFGPLLTLDDAWMIEHHIQRVGPPKQVVIVHVYDIWYREIEEDTLAHVAQIPLSSNEIEDFEPPLRLNQEDQIKMILHRYAPLYSSNETLSDWIRDPVESFRESREFTVTDSGFMPIRRPKPVYVRRDVRNHLEFVRENNFSMSPINQNAMARIKQLAEQHDFDVYLASSPIYEGLYADQAFQRYFNRVNRQLNTFDNQSDRIHYVLKEPVTFDADQMRNVDHVIESAAEDYSDRLVNAIQSTRRTTQPSFTP